MKPVPFHLQIRYARERLGLTQPDIAAELGVSTFTVSSWDSGRHSPHVHFAISYARLVQLEFIVTRNGRAVCPLEDVVPDIGRLRENTVRLVYVAQRLRISKNAVKAFEMRCGSGQTQVSSLHTYLSAIRHGLRLSPIAAQQVA